MMKATGFIIASMLILLFLLSSGWCQPQAPLDDEEAEFEAPDIVVGQRDIPDRETICSEVLNNARFTISHQFSYKTKSPRKVVTNRLALQMKWEQLFGESYYFLLDGKTTLFTGNDHQSEADDEDYEIRTRLREGYIQASFGRLNMKVGKQIVVWGESEGAVVTDVVSPRDLSEFFFTTLEESRIGQTMVSVNLFSWASQWTLLINPDPRTVEEPDRRTEYYLELWDTDLFEVIEEEPDETDTELSFRWKRTFGKSDVSIMLAHLTENQPVFRFTGLTSTDKFMLIKEYGSLKMAGVTANLSRGKFLWKCELAYKSDRSFQSLSLAGNIDPAEKDTIDAALGLEYNANGAYFVLLEASNQLIRDWSDDIQGTRRNQSNLYGSWSKLFIYDTLTLGYSFYYQIQDRDSFHKVNLSYGFTDNFMGSLEYGHLYVRDKDSLLWNFRDQNRITVELEYHF